MAKTINTNKTSKARSGSLIPELTPAIEKGYNILLSGLHGIGKTFAVMQAMEDLEWDMKYYSTSTLDPYVDLVGVPVPVDNDDGTKRLQMVRPEDINNVDAVFFDELNRADPKTLNAVFEIVQFRTINGEPLPRLKSVIAAINPTDGAYNTEELDPALIDRFHLFFQIDPRSPKAYLKQKYDSGLVDAFILWWSNHKSGKREYYCSPRRLEYMIDIYSRTNSFDLLKRSVPHGTVMDWAMLKSNIDMFESGEDIGKMSSTENIVTRMQQQTFWNKKNVDANLDVITKHFETNPNDALTGEMFRNMLATDPRIGVVFLNKWIDLMAMRCESDPLLIPEIKKTWKADKVRQVANKAYKKYRSQYSQGATPERQRLYKFYSGMYGK